jgi:hypothetical protein
MGKYNIGNKFISNQGYEFVIIEKLKNDRRIIKILDEYEAELNVSCTNIKNGAISNPYHKSVYGVGYIGEGKYCSKIKGKNTKEYICWSRLIERLHKDDLKFLTYKNTSLCEDWYNFQNFAEWYMNNIPKIDGIDFEIDKDLLQQNVKNKIYSPSTCIFLPCNVNNFLSIKNNNEFTGVSKPYKKSKKFVARCTYFKTGERKYLGVFTTKDEAYEAYIVEKRKSLNQVVDYMVSLKIYSEYHINILKQYIDNCLERKEEMINSILENGQVVDDITIKELLDKH